jgi:hypothetical protein
VRRPLRLGKRAGLVAEERQRGLKVQRSRVIGRRADPCLAESGKDAVALRRTAYEEVVDVAGLVLRQVDELAEPELGVPRGSLAPAAVPRVELREEDAEERGLELVEARVVADEVELLLVARAVEREHAHAIGKICVARRDEAAVTKAEEVLRRIEAVGRDDAPLCNSRRTEGLRCVLDHRQAELHQVVHRSRTAEQVHGHDRASPVGDLCGDVLGIDIERHRVDIGEHRGRAAARNRLGRRIEGEGGADHLVARADPHRVENDHDGIGAVGDADGLLHAQVGGGLLLERPVVRPADELSALQNLSEKGLELRLQRSVLGVDVNERNRHGESL